MSLDIAEPAFHRHRHSEPVTRGAAANPRLADRIAPGSGMNPPALYQPRVVREHVEPRPVLHQRALEQPMCAALGMAGANQIRQPPAHRLPLKDAIGTGGSPIRIVQGAHKLRQRPVKQWIS